MNCSTEGINVLKGCLAIGAGLAITPLVVYAHELGHALLAELLFDKAHTKIKVNAYDKGGSYTFNSSNLSGLGNLIGRLKSQAIVSAAGCIAQKSATVALSSLFPYSIKSSIFPDIHLFSDIHIVIHALSTICQKVFYTGKKEDISDFLKGHDFIQFRMHAGLLPTCVLITALVGVSTLSIYHAVSQVGGDTVLYGRCLGYFY